MIDADGAVAAMLTVWMGHHAVLEMSRAHREAVMCSVARVRTRPVRACAAAAVSPACSATETVISSAFCREAFRALMMGVRAMPGRAY